MAATEYIEQLNEAQRLAVEYLDGPELVIAGAGSGKTRVLTCKIVHLLEMGFYPGSILALTFTNKAAREMLERITSMVGNDVASRLWMGTFHSIFVRFLRKHADLIGFKHDFTIYDSADSKSLVKSIIRELGLDDKIYRPGQVLNDISHAKNNLYSPEDYAADKALVRSDENAHRGRTVDIFRLYRDRCKIAGAMDFDDLLYYTNVLFRNNPDVLKSYQERFAYVLVDEYQDTNFAQNLIVRQLCQARGMLCVVGDDAQSIYSFRGANIRNILDFRKTFPTQRTFKLEENYRSTQNIVGAANSLIAANKEQIPKEAYSRKSPGERIEIVQAYNDYEEAYIVAARILQVRMRLGVPMNEVAILYRTNAQSRVLEEALRNRNIAYRVYGGLAFYQRKEIKDAISFFRLAVNPDDDEAFRRVINVPRRGIGETTVRKLLAAAMENSTSMYRAVLDADKLLLNFTKSTYTKLQAFAGMIDTFRKYAESHDAKAVATKIIETTGLLKEFMSDSTPENISKRDNLLELLKAVDDFTNEAREAGSEANTIGDFLVKASLLTDQDVDEAGEEDRVTLMTVHSAKGLEFDCVFIVGAEEELFPSPLARTASEVEEERRLMYVAITRARKFCMITYARQRMISGKTQQTSPSRFLHEIDNRYLRMMTGTNIGQAPKPRRSAVESYEQSYSVPEPHRTAPSPRRETVSPAVRPAAPQAATGDFALHAPDELKTDMRIRHPRFQTGTITDIDTSRTDSRITVLFDSDGQQRTLLLKFAKFQII